MFVYSIKGNTLKFVSVICLAAVLVVSLLLLIPHDGDTSEASGTDTEATPTVKEEKINYGKIRTNDDRIAFLSQFGWEVESEPIEEATVKIPSTFDKVLSSYNSLQKKQGLDLTEYSGKEVTRYSYKVTNYKGYDGEVTANIIIYKNRVIGGDICSADVDGFIKGFDNPNFQSGADSTANESAKSDGNTAESDGTADTNTSLSENGGAENTASTDTSQSENGNDGGNEGGGNAESSPESNG